MPLLSELPVRGDSVIIFGCGKNGKLIYRYLQKNHVGENRILCFADNNYQSVKYCCGRKVIQPELGKEIYPKSRWIISSPSNALQMQQQLQEMQVDEDDIIHITENDIKVMYKAIHKFWYNEDKYFIYEYGFSIDWKFLVTQMKNIFLRRYFQFLLNREDFTHKTDKDYKYNVSICGIFLNEAPYLREWIEFHRMVGIEHFYLYNNMSTDNYRSVLKPYVKEEVVTLIDWNVPHGQISAYWDCIERFSDDVRWIGFIDLDEFVVPRKDMIYDALKQYNNKWGAVLVYGKIYGGAEKDDRDLNGLVIEDFKRCWPKYIAEGKCFYNTMYPLSTREKNGLSLHHICWTRKRNRDVPPVSIYGKVIVPGDIHRGDGNHVAMQLNHYMIKSYSEHRKKIARPDPTFEVNSRTDAGFWEVDRKATGTDSLIEQYIPELKRRLKGSGEDSESETLYKQY